MNQGMPPRRRPLTQAELYMGEPGMGAGALSATPLRDALEGWSSAGTMTTGDKNKVVSMQQPFPKTGSYTLLFNLDPLQTNLNLAAIRAEAEIYWMVAGNNVRRKINIGDGTTISGVAQAVNVVVRDVTCNLPNAAGGFDYQVSIMAAPGVRATGGTPPTLSPFPNVDPVNIIPLITVGPGLISAAILVPKGVGINAVHVDVVDLVTGAVIPDQSAIVLQGQGGVTIRAYDPRAIDWCPLQPGTQTISFFNQSLATTMIFYPIFGVDG